MKKGKKIIALTSTYALVAALAIGGTIAYLKDEASDVNVMTLGNVDIVQLEYERVVEDGQWVSSGETDKYGYSPDVLKDFGDAKPLYPAVFADGDIKWDDRNGSQAASGSASHQQSWGQIGAPGSNQLFDDSVKNALDKFVFVENTGKSDAYVRTLFAFEQGDVEADRFSDIIMTNVNATHYAWETVATDVKINDNTYVIKCATYLGPKSNPTGILEPGAKTYPSLLQVYMRPEATNDDVRDIDGNGNGTYEILVLSQATQVKGFEGSAKDITVEENKVYNNASVALDTAFGELYNEANLVEWFENMVIPGIISNATQAYESTLESGEYTLSSDYYTSDSALHFSKNREYAVKSGNEYILNLNGHTINHDGTYQDGKNTGYTYLVTTAYEGKLTVNGEGTIKSENTEGNCCIFYAQGPSEIIINGGNYYATRGTPVWAGKGANITINGGSFISDGSNDQELVYSSGGIIDIYGGFFHNTGWENRPVNVANANRGTGFINIYGGTFVNFDPSSGGDDPNNIKVMDGYKVVSETQDNGDIWYTVVKE